MYLCLAYYCCVWLITVLDVLVFGLLLLLIYHSSSSYINLVFLPCYVFGINLVFALLCIWYKFSIFVNRSLNRFVSCNLLIFVSCSCSKKMTRIVIVSCSCSTLTGSCLNRFVSCRVVSDLLCQL